MERQPKLNRKQELEYRRRDEINRRLEELRQLIQEDSTNRKISQEQVLKEALKVANEMKRTSSRNPYLRGLFENYDKIKSLATSYIKTIEIDEKTKMNHIKNVNEVFNNYREFLSNSTDPSPSSIVPKPIQKTFTTEEKELKRKKADREQLRRDRQNCVYDALSMFILKNNLSDGEVKIQRLHILEIIIKYISGRNKEDPEMTSDEKDQFKRGCIDGQTVAKGLANLIFKNDLQLIPHLIVLEFYYQINLNPMPLFGLPAPPYVLPNPSNHSLITPESPQESMGSPSLSSPSSTFSTPDEEKNVSSRQIEDIFRPYLL